jgi:hypothetical protein
MRKRSLQEVNTQEELREELWQAVPPLRRMIVGRERIDDIITMAIENAPLEYIHLVGQPGEEQNVVLKTWEADVKRCYCLVCGDEVTFGPLFWILIGPIVQLILKKLLEWWFDSHSHRLLMAGWKKEMTQ